MINIRYSLVSFLCVNCTELNYQWQHEVVQTKQRSRAVSEQERLVSRGKRGALSDERTDRRTDGQAQQDIEGSLFFSQTVLLLKTRQAFCLHDCLCWLEYTRIKSKDTRTLPHFTRYSMDTAEHTVWFHIVAMVNVTYEVQQNTQTNVKTNCTEVWWCRPSKTRIKING